MARKILRPAKKPNFLIRDRDRLQRRADVQRPVLDQPDDVAVGDLALQADVGGAEESLVAPRDPERLPGSHAASQPSTRRFLA